MYKLKAFLLGIFVSLSSTILVYAQTGASPYSTRGIGELGTMELPHNIGMGGVGISQPQSRFLNNLNPALLPNNTLTHFGLGIMSDYKRITGQEASTTNLGGGLHHLTFAFPIITRKWTLSSGLIPYSSVNYDYQETGAVVAGTNTIANKDFSGEGGISRAYIANGVQLTNNFAIGLQVNYLFGSIINETGTQLVGEDVPSAYRTSVYDRTKFSDISFKGGLAYSKQIRSMTFFNAGVTYELGGNTNAQNFVRLERQMVAANAIQVISQDTIFNNIRGFVNLPSSLGFGVSLHKTLNWSIGSDVTFQNWSDYRNFNGNNDGMTNSYKIAIGGDFTPNAASLDNYLNHITYRMGVNYENTPINISGINTNGEAYFEQIKDFGINFGMSLPVGPRFASSLDLGFKLGRRGTLSNNLIREDYFRMFLGVTFNDKWFQRRKFD